MITCEYSVDVIVVVVAVVVIIVVVVFAVAVCMTCEMNLQKPSLSSSVSGRM